MAKDFFKKMVSRLNDPNIVMASEGESSAEFTGWIDSGSYALNAALSGSLFGGFQNNKVCVLAGETSVGKTFLALSIVKAFLAANSEAHVGYCDTESAVNNEMFDAQGIDHERIIRIGANTIEEFRTNAIRVIDDYGSTDDTKRPPLMLVLDSLSMLPSKKETADMTEGNDVRDMTKAQLIKGAFRVLRLKLAKCRVPLIVTSHTYVVVGAYVPTKEMAGGSGAKYAADSIVFLSKKKDRTEDAHTGNIIHVQMVKSRLSREGTKIDTRIQFDGGLDRYYGLLPIAETAGIVKKVASKYEFPDGTKAFEKAVLKNPTKYWTQDVLNQLEAVIAPQFKYLNTPPVEDNDDGEGA